MRFSSHFSLALTIAFWGITAQAVESPRPMKILIEDACPSVPPESRSQSALAAMAAEAIASHLIGVAVDAAGSYLAAATETKSVAFRGTQDGSFYNMNAMGTLEPQSGGQGCIVLFVPGTGEKTDWFKEVQQRTPELQNLTAMPQFYFEIAFKQAGDGIATFLVSNQFIHVGSFQGTGWSYGSERNYSIAITFRNREDGQVIGAASFDLPGLTKGTWGSTQIYAIQDGKTELTDKTIVASLNPAANAQRIPFFPVGPSIESASATQKAVAQPFLRAARVINGVPAEPLIREPEWVVNGEKKPSVKAAQFITKLRALCELQEKAGKDFVGTKDPRCPLKNLQAANELDEAKSALKEELEKEWAANFAIAHSDFCKPTPQGVMVCKPSAPEKTLYGAYSWEATVVETREATAFAKSLSAIFNANKDKLKTQLQNELPSKQDEASKSAESAKRDAQLAYKLAMLKVDEAEAKLLESVTQPKSAQIILQADLLRAKAGANTAARAAGQATPFDL